MQRGTITRHGNGWRGSWREDPTPEWPKGQRCATKVCRTQGEAKRLLKAELDRLELGASYRVPVTVDQLCERFLEQYNAAPQTVKYARRRLVRPRALFGGAQAGDVTTEALQRFITGLPVEKVGKAYRRDIARTLRMVYGFGVDAGIVSANPATTVKAPAQVRSDRIIPFESWAEVERVAEECGRWGPLVLFMADTGARPAEAVGVDHRHVDGNIVELPGRKTEGAWRTVHMTERGVGAIDAMPRAITTRRVFHIEGRPISWVYFWREVWRPALELAELAYRPPYNLRHTFAYWSLRAGVPIASVAREMGHTSTEQTFKVYGGWCREMGADAAALRSAWASGAIVEPDTAESES